MINFENEKKMYDMFIENDILTTKELLSVGFSSLDLSKLVENGTIKRVKKGYYSLSDVMDLLKYSKEMFKLEGLTSLQGNLALDKCIEMEPNNSYAHMLLFLKKIFEKDWKSAFEDFRILDKAENEEYKRNNNLWLYLLSFVIELPEEYCDRVKNMTTQDVFSLDDDSLDKIKRNRIKSLIIQGNFKDACLELNDSQEHNSGIFSFVVSRLLWAAQKETKRKLQHICSLLDEEKYAEVERLLEDENNVHDIGLYNNQILIMVKDLRNLLEKQETPIFLESNNTANFLDLIRNHDYKRALARYYRFQENKRNKYIGLLLTRINEEINKIEDKQAREELVKKIFNNINLHFVNNDVGMALGELDLYLEKIDANEYRELITDLIKLDLLDKDLEFSNTMYELNNIGNDDYKFDPLVYMHDFYLNLMNKNYKKAAIILDIISMSKEFGKVVIDTNDMERELASRLENDGVEKELLEVKLPEAKVVDESSYDVIDNWVVSKFYTLPDIVSKVISGEKVAMLEPMSEGDINTVVALTSNVNKLKTEIIEEKNGDKRVVFRNVDKTGGYIDVGQTLRAANSKFKSKEYDEAIGYYESVLPILDDPKGFIYAGIGLGYYKSPELNDCRKVIDYLTLATYAKDNTEYDYTGLINRLKRQSGYNGVKVDMTSTEGGYKMESTQYKKV